MSFLQQLKQLCLEFDLEASTYPDLELAGLALYNFFLTKEVTQRVKTKSDLEYQFEYRQKDGYFQEEPVKKYEITPKWHTNDPRWLNKEITILYYDAETVEFSSDDGTFIQLHTLSPKKFDEIFTEK